MSFFSLFSRKNNVEQQVEQLRTELHQQMQGLQQVIIGEIRQASKGTSAVFNDQVEKMHKDVRQTSKNIDTIHDCIDRLHPPLAHIEPLKEQVSQLCTEMKLLVIIREEIKQLQKQIAQLVSPDIEKGSIDDDIIAQIQAARILQSARKKYQDVTQKVEKSVRKGLGNIADTEDDIYASTLNPSPYLEHLLGPIRKPLGDAPPPEATSPVDTSI